MALSKEGDLESFGRGLVMVKAAIINQDFDRGYQERRLGLTHSPSTLSNYKETRSSSSYILCVQTPPSFYIRPGISASKRRKKQGERDAQPSTHDPIFSSKLSLLPSTTEKSRSIGIPTWAELFV